MHKKMLNGLSPAQFLRRHWQKKPLLARAGLPEFADLLNRKRLIELALLPEAESRLITRKGRQWTVRHGPFRRQDFAKLPDRDWTLLVQGVDLLLPRGKELIGRFDFISYARLDDLMVSYAPPGGGVGPHFDSYDVFLLQGEGRRRWQVSSQRDLTLIDGAPLKILRDFKPAHEWTLDAGDLLYLPPRYAHDGVAMSDCITLSVGFRAPSAQDLCARFLDFMQDNLDARGLYADPGLKPTRQPARIAPQMAKGLLKMLAQARSSRADMLRFIGEDLSTPKSQVVFEPPRRAMTLPAFAKAIRQQGLQLCAASILLYDDKALYMNGERCEPPAAARPLLRRFADHRMLAPARAIPAAAAEVLYDWYRAGFVTPASD
jgi:50S ribosomal protein L16 3-hydroxylase